MNRVVIVGVGEVVEQVRADLESAASPLDLMVRAAEAALSDAGTSDCKTALDTIAVIRTTSDMAAQLKSPFGDPENYPVSVARRLGIAPDDAIYTIGGGHAPQALVNDFSDEIRTGKREAILLVGAEAVANQKALLNSGIKADWRNDISGMMHDQGADGYKTLDISQLYNGLLNIPAIYSIFENARRARIGKTSAEYAKECGDLFAPFSRVASAHPNSMFKDEYSAEQIAQRSPVNGAVTDIYTRAMVAKDGVNLGASVILMCESKALELGIDRSRFIYPVSGSESTEKTISYREDLGQSVAMKVAYDAALSEAGISIKDISAMDLYSCFPIAVFAACEALEISPNDPRGLTLTGGLPFFGGPGNNYSMHAIVNIVQKLRETENQFGLVGANGGFLSKHAVGIYSSGAPVEGFRKANKSAIAAKVDEQSMPEVTSFAEGRATIETFSVEFDRKGPGRGFVFGRTADGKRFLGSTDPADTQTVQELLERDPIGREIFVTSKGPGTRFTFDEETTRALIPPLPASLEGAFKHILVERNGSILEVTINRPEARNSLTPDANFELEHVFDLFQEDRSLWVAIITGAGDKSFCAGNDLKYSATGKTVWVPETGFGGLTNRANRSKPVIAAVNGFAVGGGLEIALACDVIIASETAIFALPEVKSGLIAAAGGIFRLPEAIPPHVAREMMLTGRNMDVDEALHWGLVNHKAKPNQVMEKAREIAKQICEGSPTAVSATLQMLEGGAGEADPIAALATQDEPILRFISSEDLQIGLAAFVAKQKPEWKNR